MALYFGVLPAAGAAACLAIGEAFQVGVEVAIAPLVHSVHSPSRSETTGTSLQRIMRADWPLACARRTAAVALCRLRKTRRRYLPVGVDTITAYASAAASMSA